MDRQDQHKRAYSQAFPRMNQSRHGDQPAQPAKRILSYPLNSTGAYHEETDQENECPLDLNTTATSDEIPGTQIRHPPMVDLQYANPALYNFSSLQYELYGNGPKSDLRYDAGSSPPPLLCDRQPRFPPRYDSLPTPSIVRGQSMFGPSPYVRPDLSSSSNYIVDSYTQPETELSPMSDASTAVGPMTPSALNFGDLTLNTQRHSLPSSPLQHDGQAGRTIVKVASVASFASHFPEVNPNEVVILFDKGRSLLKIDKYPLCSASRLFAQLLDGPFLDHGLTHCIRLRGDFPYAITTMFHFIETGNYMFDQRAFTAYPLLTAVDFHIHIYLSGSKYGLVALRHHAINAYLDIAEHELRLGFLAISSGKLSDAHVSVPGFPIIPPVDGQAEGETAITPIDRFLNSLVLLWKNTHSRFDALRETVLELIKRNLNKLLRVPFFVTLMQEVVGFGDDLVASLGDDGFEVKAFQVPAGGRLSQTVRFEI